MRIGLIDGVITRLYFKAAPNLKITKDKYLWIKNKRQ